MSFYLDNIFFGLFKDETVNSGKDRFYTDNFFYGDKDHTESDNFYQEGNYFNDNKF